MELIRGKCGRIFGLLNGLFISIKGLPSTYNKDLQDDKKAMFDAYDTILLCLQVSQGIMETLQVNEKAMKAAVTPDMMATELADYLVRKGVPFRDTHHIAGQCVIKSEKEKKTLDKLTMKELQEIDSRFGGDVFKAFDVDVAIERRNAIGGTGSTSITGQIASINKQIK